MKGKIARFLFVLTPILFLQNVMAMELSRIQRIERYVLNAFESEILTEDDQNFLQSFPFSKKYENRIHSIFKVNQLNCKKYSLTTPEAQFIEDKIATAESPEDLIFAEVPDWEGLWERFMHCGTFFRENDAVNEVQLLRRWRERNLSFLHQQQDVTGGL